MGKLLIGDHSDGALTPFVEHRLRAPREEARAILDFGWDGARPSHTMQPSPLIAVIA